MPKRLCSSPRCPSPAHYRGYCQRHARAKDKQTNRAGRAIYNTKRWQQTRKAVLSKQPLCECGAIATDVHHKIDLDDGGAPWDQGNLEALCHSCHSRETRNRMNKRGGGGSRP